MNKLILLGVVLGLLSMALAHNVPYPPPKETGSHGGSGGDGFKHGGSGGGGSGGGGTGGGGSGGGGIGGGGGITSCPRPSPESIRCLQQWACQNIIRLDLRCLLTLNGNNLLGNLISIPGVSGGGTSGGILGGLLGN